MHTHVCVHVVTKTNIIVQIKCPGLQKNRPSVDKSGRVRTPMLSTVRQKEGRGKSIKKVD